MSKIVVLGAAHPHVLALAASAAGVVGAELAGVWDDDEARRASAAGRLGIPALRSLDAALALGPDLVLTGAVPCDRVAIARRAVAAGAAVLADKPLALTHADLDASIEAVARFRRPILAYYPFRGEPMVQAAMRALQAGLIGTLVRAMSCGPHRLNAASRPAWHWTRRHNGGCLIDIASHHVDLCCWFAGESPDWLSARHANRSQPEHREFQDFAQVQLHFPGGALAHVEADWLTPASMRTFGDTRIWLQGTSGKIELRLGDERSALLWTAEHAARALELEAGASEERWSATLLADLCAGRPCAIGQDEVWRTSRVTLHAFDSAQAGGRPVDAMTCP